MVRPILQIIVDHCHPNVRKSKRKLEYILSIYFLASNVAQISKKFRIYRMEIKEIVKTNKRSASWIRLWILHIRINSNSKHACFCLPLEVGSTLVSHSNLKLFWLPNVRNRELGTMTSWHHGDIISTGKDRNFQNREEF
jgi:hypothetical protein